MMCCKKRHTGYSAALAPGTRGMWRQCEAHSFAEVALFEKALAEEMIALDYSFRDLFAVRLAFDEAVVNAIKHGHRGDPTRRIGLSYRVTGEKVEVEVVDEGPGFDPDAIPDPRTPENLERTSGRGVFLMRAYMTSVQFIAPGNCVRLCKQRST